MVYSPLHMNIPLLLQLQQACGPMEHTSVIQEDQSMTLLVHMCRRKWQLVACEGGGGGGGGVNVKEINTHDSYGKGQHTRQLC